MGLGAIALGMGAALACGAGMAQADATPSGAQAGTSAANAGPKHSTARRESTGRPAASASEQRSTAIRKSNVPELPAAVRRAPAISARTVPTLRVSANPRSLPPKPGSAAELAGVVALAGRDVESVGTSRRLAGESPLTTAAAVTGETVAAAGPAGQAVQTLVGDIGAAVAATVRAIGDVVRFAVHAVVTTVRTVARAITAAIEIALHPAPYAHGPTVGMPDTATGAITGTLGFSAPGGLPLSYTVTTGPTQGTVTVSDSGTYTYTPSTAARLAADGTVALTDTFVVTASDRFGSTTQTVTVPVAPARYVVQVPDSVLSAREPNFTPDGKSLVFSATPQGGGRSEIYRIDLDGSDFQCLSCGLAPS
ncbi:hypothetical protein B1R94_03185 [Mycolicibacterium litorale]|nr:hypothetical protein B1R94_03185 [Mycolicibacterium litorale]